MSSFTQQVNAKLSQQKTSVDLQKERESIIVHDVQAAAEYIRREILRRASYYKGSDPFVFRGYLNYHLGAFHDIMLFTTEEKHVGLLTQVRERTYQLNQFGRIFHSLLQQELQRDGIQTSDWIVIFASCSDADLDWIYNMSSGSFTFLNLRTNDFRSGPYLLNAPIVYRSGEGIHECRYQNKKYLSGLAHVCIQIDYRNQ